MSFLESSVKTEVSEVATQLCVGRRCPPLLNSGGRLVFVATHIGSFRRRPGEVTHLHVCLHRDVGVMAFTPSRRSCGHEAFARFRENGENLRTDVQMTHESVIMEKAPKPGL